MIVNAFNGLLFALLLSNNDYHHAGALDRVRRRKMLRQRKDANSFFGNLNPITSTGSNQPSATKSPNILLILADDVGTGDIPVYWNSSLVDMPNLDRLASMGVLFRDAHSTPLCAPSRYMLLSGNYAHRGFHPNGSWGFWRDSNQFVKGQQSIAQTLRDEAGYRTGMFGKWHLGAKAPPHGIDRANDNFARLLTNPKFDWTQKLIQGPTDIGFDDSYITIEGIQKPPYSFFRDGVLTTASEDITYWESGYHASPNGLSQILKDSPGEGDNSWDSAAFNMIVVNETERFVDEHLENNPEDPFFAYVALGAAHIPHSPPNQYLDGTDVKKVYQTRHLDMLLEMDKVVGSLVSMIEDRGLEKETIIIFSSDNGGLNNSHQTGHLTSGPLRGKKGNIYEGGHRVPLIFRYDGVFPANESRNKLFGLNDIYATICKLVGIQVPAGSAQDSVNYAHYIKDDDNRENLRRFLGTWSFDSPTQKRREEAMRLGPLKLIHFFENATDALYDLHDDLSETKNLINDPDYAKKIRRMKRKLDKTGPCPSKDHGSLFKVKRLRGKKKKCSWFAKNKEKRCDLYFEGELHCFSICGRNKSMC